MKHQKAGKEDSRRDVSEMFREKKRKGQRAHKSPPSSRVTYEEQPQAGAEKNDRGDAELGHVPIQAVHPVVVQQNVDDDLREKSRGRGHEGSRHHHIAKGLDARHGMLLVAQHEVGPCDPSAHAIEEAKGHAGD